MQREYRSCERAYNRQFIDHRYYRPIVHRGIAHAVNQRQLVLCRSYRHRRPAVHRSIAYAVNQRQLVLRWPNSYGFAFQQLLDFCKFDERVWNGHCATWYWCLELSEQQHDDTNHGK